MRFIFSILCILQGVVYMYTYLNLKTQKFTVSMGVLFGYVWTKGITVKIFLRFQI